MIFPAENTRADKRGPLLGLTLVELLVSMAIVSILAALIVGVAGVAGETAREARTRQLIARLHTQLMERYDQYRYQRVELNRADRPPVVNMVEDYRDYLAASGLFITSGWTNGQVEAAGRLQALRETMRMEMPDRWSDVYLKPLPASLTEIEPEDFGGPLFASQRPTLSRLYSRRLQAMINAGVSRDDLMANQSAECLYLVVMNATSDGEAAGLFKPADIGDVDGDGAPEFLDGWGNPIRFLRWAPGFESDSQLGFNQLARIYRDTKKDFNGAAASDGDKLKAVQQAINNDFDPFDPFRVDGPNMTNFEVDTGGASGGGPAARGFRIMPLIYSDGGDEDSDIYSAANFFNRFSDPYSLHEDPSLGLGIGQEMSDARAVLAPSIDSDGDNYADNITNHDIATRTN
ncbi:hypothetical protein Mal64_24740 [Pseudobythopirellula maris]|uniref:Uncharacterized protein n=1 Tax=Pseudobythopirellula maris TaxID=2527991 RepID=A0A5C5ZRY0_9BACT|nr:prepilin-type N-terminal cleavage/methylation domain-containing protein [Pseudobythopirellula maris]TWT88983.1 hypothetical protein Mal64_24740 [Pseudobythopirellula maris]